MKKYYLTLAVMAIFAIGFSASDDESSESSSEETSKEQVEEQQPAPAPKPDFLGTYEVRDKAGLMYHFILKEGGTVDIIINPHIEHGEHLTLTGKWKDCRKQNCGLQICYDDSERIPALCFPNGRHNSSMDKCAYLCEGYYYPDFFTCDDRKGGWRVEYTKIN